MSPGNVTNGTPIHSPFPSLNANPEKGEEREGGMGLISFINVAIDRIRASRERERGAQREEGDWRKSEGRGKKKEMRSQSMHKTAAQTLERISLMERLLSAPNNDILELFTSKF